MTEDFICERCGSKVAGKAYRDEYGIVESRYDCKCGFKWDWAYGQHCYGSTIFKEQNQDYLKEKITNMFDLGWDIKTIQEQTDLTATEILALKQ